MIALDITGQHGHVDTNTEHIAGDLPGEGIASTYVPS